MSQRRAASEPPAGVPPETEAQALRARLVGQRRALSQAVVADASVRISTRLSHDMRVRRAATAGPVGLYWPVRGEPDVRPATVRSGTDTDHNNRALAAPHGLTLPGHPAADPQMLQWRSDGPLAEAWGSLRYPAEGAPAVAPSEHGVILVPAVAFDRSGNRLGNGGGWYDRLLAGLGRTDTDETADPTPLLIGVGHGFQLLERLETQPWDVPMHLVVTPDELITARGLAS